MTREAEDGWIEWKGGDCPVDPEVLVLTLHRQLGQYGPHKARHWGTDETSNWHDDGHPADIIAYRIVKP